VRDETHIKVVFPNPDSPTTIKVKCPPRLATKQVITGGRRSELLREGGRVWKRDNNNDQLAIDDVYLLEEDILTNLVPLFVTIIRDERRREGSFVSVWSINKTRASDGPYLVG